MRLGVENRNSVYVAIALGLVAIYLVWRTFFSGGGEVIASKPPAAAQVAATTAGPAARRIRSGRRAGPAQKQTVTASLDPRLRLDLLKGSSETEYKGSGRNIFRAEKEIEIPKAVDNGVKKREEEAKSLPPAPPPGPPPAPPINLKFFGFANRAGETRQVFLSQNDDVFIAREGDVVNRRYKVVKINNNSVEIEDLLGNNRQTIPLTAG